MYFAGGGSLNDVASFQESDPLVFQLVMNLHADQASYHASFMEHCVKLKTHVCIFASMGTFRINCGTDRMDFMH